MNDDTLDVLSLAVTGRIKNDALFAAAEVPVFEHRHGVLIDDINAAVQSIGICVRIAQPTLQDAKVGGLGLEATARIQVLIHEMPVTNETDVTCGKAAMNVMRLFCPWFFGYTGNSLSIGPSPEEVRDDLAGEITRVININTQVILKGSDVQRVLMPKFTKSGNTLTITCLTDNAVIRSVAWPRGTPMPELPAADDDDGEVDGVIRFSDSYTFSSAMEVLSIAYLDGKTASDVASSYFEVSTIPNGSIGTEDGAPLSTEGGDYIVTE